MTLAPAPERIGMSMEEFLRRSAESKFEILGQEIVPKVPTVSGHSKTIKRLVRVFMPFEDKKLGEVFSETTFVLEDVSDWIRGSRIPDVMWIGREKLDAFYGIVSEADTKPFVLIPDIVIEVLSPTDKYSEIASKVDFYLRDGVLLIWVVDFDAQTVVVHAAEKSPVILRGTDTLTAGELLPGFSATITELFSHGA